MQKGITKKSLPASTNGKGVQISFNKKGVFASPSETLQIKKIITIPQSLLSW